jgi:hypothetical protein
MTEEQVQTLITERLLAFEAQLVRDGRLQRGYPPEPPFAITQGTHTAIPQERIPGIDDDKAR